MLRVCLDDSELLQLLRLATEDFARGTAPEEAMNLFKMATMTALRKKTEATRGIATGTTFRRLVARTLARQFVREVEKTCAPFQFALSTRAGTDCVEHLIWASTDANPTLTVLSVDGIGACDHVLRSAMLERLLQMPAARTILPFVRLSDGSPSSYTWVDDEGRQRIVTQAEGGEQGDPLMPSLLHWHSRRARRSGHILGPRGRFVRFP